MVPERVRQLAVPDPVERQFQHEQRDRDGEHPIAEHLDARHRRLPIGHRLLPHGEAGETKIALMKRLVLLLAAFLVAASAGSAFAATRPVLWVGNNWDGTADAVDPFTFKRLAHLNIVPDKQERLDEIMLDPARQGYFLGIRQLVGEGHDQFVDDMFTSHDGRFLYVSRPSLADVAAFDLTNGGQNIWRTPLDGHRPRPQADPPAR